MNYQRARKWLKEIEKYGSVLGLDSMRALAFRLGNPQKDLQFVHIAGTNGKGSTLAYISNIVKESGYRVGAYISPTVFSYREKIQVNGEHIGKEDFALLTEKVSIAVSQMLIEGLPHPTVFEVETMISFLYFKEKKCDLVVLECGLGGLTDATNIIENTKVAVFSPISLDHMAFLGNTIEEIAKVKSGIIKEGAEVVSAIQSPSVEAVLAEAAKRMDCDFEAVKESDISLKKYDLDGNEFFYENEIYKTSLIGDYQTENASLAIKAAKKLQKYFPKITKETIKKGLWKASWLGRFSVVEKNPYLLIDGAHNRAGAAHLATSLRKYFPDKQFIFVCGMFSDKEYDKILEITAPLAEEIIAVETKNNPRALLARDLADHAKRYCKKVYCEPDIVEALALAKKERGGDLEKVIVVFGSLSFLREIVLSGED